MAIVRNQDGTTSFNYDIVAAIQRVRPDGKFTVVGDTYEGFSWSSANSDADGKPTIDELSAAADELAAEYEAFQYGRDRIRKYRKAGIMWEEMLYALWDKVMEDNSTSADAIQAKRLAIKQEIPKPES